MHFADKVQKKTITPAVDVQIVMSAKYDAVSVDVGLEIKECSHLAEPQQHIEVTSGLHFVFANVLVLICGKEFQCQIQQHMVSPMVGLQKVYGKVVIRCKLLKVRRP